MKKNQIKLFFIFLFFVGNVSLASDYYPEMGMDPFFSSLNPMYIDKEEMPENQDSIIGIIKKKKQTRAEKKLQKEQNRKRDSIEYSPMYDEELDINENNKIEEEKAVSNDENFVTKPKKGLTKAELEKELKKEEREKQKALEALNKPKTESSFKDKFFFFKKNKKDKIESNEKVNPNIELSADYLEYFPDRFEVEAIGNAKVAFKSQDVMLSANKIVFNYDRNILKASENVVLTASSSITEGDFIRIDLSQPSGWIENPVTRTEDIQLSAKEAFIYSDRIEENDGVVKIMRDEVLSLGSRSFASYVDPGHVFQARNNKISDKGKGVYKIKANTIVIDSKDDHEVVTIKNADLYVKNRRIAAIPSIKLVTNKQHAAVESNIPEFGSQSRLGIHLGPSVLLNVPGGSVLKLAPILTYDDDKLGIGGIARFRNKYNMTEVAYGTSHDELLIRGRHKLAPGLLFNYSRLTNQGEWFLGYRRPKYSANLSYSRSDYIDDLKLTFSQMYSAGVYMEDAPNVDWGDAEGRFRWMTQTFKPVYKYTNEEGNVSVNLGLVAQTAATVYTSGDTTGIFRVGPAVNTRIGPWNQALMYFQTATTGESPFYFDRYRYGRSNVVLVESLKVCKFLSLGYLASLAMNSDYHDDKMLQESRILVSVGPEYAKFTVGYDAHRRNTMFILSMLVGTKDSDVTFKKTILKNPEKFGKTKHKKVKKKNYKKYLKQDV